MAKVGLSSGDLLPPSYADAPSYPDNFNQSVSDERPSDSDLPSYNQSGHPPPTQTPIVRRVAKEFDYTMEKHGKTFLVITLVSNEPYPKPVFMEGSPVQGKIHLALDHHNVHSVVVSLKGSLITGGIGFSGFTSVFLEKTQTLWSREDLDKSGTLEGDHTWPFSFELPKQVEVIEGAYHQPKMFPLPQTFHQRYIHSTIQYDIFVKVVRKGFLASDDTLSTPFVYIPVTHPPDLPPLRRLAYEEGTPLLGPKVDPDGWYLQNSVQIQGNAFKNRNCRVECRLFLAKPLSYTRGSVIPLFIHLESDDQQVLELLSVPSAISVRVRQRTKWTPTPHSRLESTVWRDEINHSQRAVWWPVQEHSEDNGSEQVRRLQGELHLKPDMAPSSALGNFKVEYSVVLLQFNTPSFTQVTEGPLLFEEPITIVTAFAPGPRPRMTTPANYTPDEKRNADDLQTNGEYSAGFY